MKWSVWNARRKKDVWYISHVLTLLIVFHAPGSRDYVPFVVNLLKKKSVHIECKDRNCAIFTKLANSPIMCNRGAIAPKTAVDLFPFCGAITFFSSSIKRAAIENLEIMQSYTIRADELYLEAENVQIPDYIPPFTNCYETLLPSRRTHWMRQNNGGFSTTNSSLVSNHCRLGIPATYLDSAQKGGGLGQKRKVYVLHRTTFACGTSNYRKQTPTCCFDQKAIQRTTLFSFSGLLILMTRFAVFKKTQRWLKRKFWLIATNFGLKWKTFHHREDLPFTCSTTTSR